MPGKTFYIIIFYYIVLLLSCGKNESSPSSNPCAGVTVNVTGNITNPSAPGASNGSITVTVTGASGFTYSLNGGPFQSSPTFSGLPEGTYTVTAKNSNGCTGTATFTLTAPNPCAGVTITVSGSSNNPTTSGGNNGSINATASGGTPPYTFSLNGGAFQASGNFTNLTAGVYTVTARDANNCTGSANFTLSDPCTGVTITVSGTVTNPSAPGATNGSITASASGGIAPYEYRIGSGAYQSFGTFTGLGAGTYTITARDSRLCTGSATFTLTAPNPCAGVTINVSTTITGNTPCTSPPTGSITASATGGTAPYTFSLNGGAFQSSPTFSNLNAGNYTIAARDANGCTGSAPATVPNLPAGPLFTQVRTLIQNHCVSCHNAGAANGGVNLQPDCNIVNFRQRILERAVNGNPSPMPPSGLLPASERQKITDWINAGGRYTD
ncbi:MAG: hypothetical protein N2747_05210 [Chitinophagaceae bacterium]|nr:hypothetical protein [Chitinophagaceae bacterium]